MADRSDVSDRSVAVMLPIPTALAEGWPDLGKSMPPHVTVVYMPDVDPAQVDDVVLVIADELHARWSDLGRVTPDESVYDYETSLARIGEFSLRFSGLRYFDNEEQRVAYAAVSVPLDLARARDRLVARLQNINVGIARIGQTWIPHATLGFLQSGQVYEGFVPEGEWTPETLEVWHGNDVRYIVGPGAASGIDKVERIGNRWVAYRDAGRTKVGEYASEADARKGLAEDATDRQLTGRYDKIEEREGKWVVLSEDGTKELGTYDTEAEARERLRQVEAAKAAKGDAPTDGDGSALERADLGEPSEDTIKLWLREHISDARKMPRDRMRVLASLKDRYDYLRPPPVRTVYRGLRNVKRTQAGKLVGWSDAVTDKSWTTDQAVAAKFASTEWTKEAPDDDRVGVVLVADANPEQLLLNHELIAELPGVADAYHDVWEDTLAKAIRDEKEVLSLGPLHVRTVKVVEMAAFRQPSLTDGQSRGEMQLAQDAQQVLFEPTPDGGFRVTLPLGARIQFAESPANAARADATLAAIDATLSGSRLAPAVHTESRTNTEWITRADRVSLPTEHAPIVHPEGWVTYPVLYSKGGNIQRYGNVREFRPKREVFKRASMDSGIGGPWELRHSADLLTPNTVRGVVRGVMLTFDEYHDGVHTFGWARAWDRGLMEAIEGDGVSRPEAPEVSLAFRCKVHREPGTDDFGNPFDQWISDILINSLASEPYGRAETAKVLGVRSDADAITVHGANELLALAQGSGLPSRPVVFDPGSWARFDAATMQRPEAPKSPRPSADQPNTRKDEHPMLKKLIKTAMALGMAEDAIATAIGVPADGLAAFMEGDTDLTPDQLNALVMALPDKPAAPAADADPPPAETLVKVEIGDAEYMVPPAVAEEIAAMVGKAKTDGEEMEVVKDRAKRASARADAAEEALAKAEVELVKRADSIKDMVTRADAQTMATEYGTRLAEAMELCRMGHGAEWQPESRKDGEGAEQTVGLDDWQRAAITAAFGERADNVLARIDAAPNPEARAYAMDMRLADARGLLAEKQHKGKAALASINRMRDENARADQQQLDGDDDDPLAAAHKNNRKFDAAPVGVPQTITSNPGAA